MRSVTFYLSCVPGVLSVSFVTLVAFLLHHLNLAFGFGTLSLAIVLGIVARSALPCAVCREPGEIAMAGILLRSGLVCLGATVSLAEMQAIGLGGMGLVVVCLLFVLLLTLWLGRGMGLDPRLTSLIALGTSVCGASAIAAGRDVARASPEHVACAIALVTLLGTCGMFILPYLVHWFDLDEFRGGLWCGATLHEVAQAVAASWQVGPDAGVIGTLAKLLRVVLLVPALFIVVFFQRRQNCDDVHVPMGLPWFVVGFTALFVMRSAGVLPGSVEEHAGLLATMLLTSGMAALGLRTDFRQLHRLGMAPLLLGCVAWIAMVALALVLLLAFMS
ncbi:MULTISPECIES: YeiH family protein [unclassified Haematospirillum]|uniref:YeiH family protein n=1 Tax=unclassified Haematospirillum TaxID=2622088 RepID=UPI001FD77FCF|nr:MULTISPECIES: putative sulfate exporter family transporter [unclassified Haematospirillum]